MVRSGAALQAIGQVSDLVPTAPELTVGDRIYIDGQEHVVGGRLQLDHGRGPWDEWYIENTQTRQWGWLAKAQGQWYGLLPRQTSGPVPAWQQLPPGAQGPFLPGVPGMWAVNEQGQSRVLSAEGELLPRLTVDHAHRLVQDGTATGGMIPKIGTAIEAVKGGVRSAVVMDGRVPHCALLHLFGDGGVGTSIVP